MLSRFGELLIAVERLRRPEANSYELARMLPKVAGEGTSTPGE
jgi:hypothetical protein